MRILSLSTHGVACGIGDYNTALQAACQAAGHVYDVEPIDREAVDLETGKNLRFLYQGFLDRISDYDAVVLQHEFGLYGNHLKQANRTFAEICKAVGATGKPYAVFMHTNFPWLRKPWHHWLPTGKSSEWRRQRQLIDILSKGPVQTFVHGRDSRKSFIAAGVKPDAVTSIMHPLKPLPAAEIRERGPSDPVNLAIFGFVSAYKGYHTALQTLSVLPERYTLTIAGGKHPNAPNDRALNDIQAFLATGRWHNNGARLSGDTLESVRRRVRVTGYVPRAEIEAIMRDTDIVLAPYTLHGPAGSGALGVSISHGKPIIASGTPGFQEVAKIGNCLKLVAVDAPYELAMAVEELTVNVEERRRLSQATAAFARAHTYEDLVVKLVDVLSGRPSRQ